MPPGARRAGPLRGSRKGDVYRIGGLDLPWDPQRDIDTPRPTPLFPDSETLPPKPLAAKEKEEVRHFLKLRNKMRTGPLYAGVVGGVGKDRGRGGETGRGGGGAMFDPFSGMRGWSERYRPRRNVLPVLGGKGFGRCFGLGFFVADADGSGVAVKELFPRELWATVYPEGEKQKELEKSAGGGVQTGKGLPTLVERRKAEELDLLENEVEEGDGEEKEREEEDEEEDMEDMDDEFDEEDDEGGDYNAEQYFDDGREDLGDDGDAG